MPVAEDPEDRFAKLYHELEVSHKRQRLVSQKLRLKKGRKAARLLKREQFKAAVATLPSCVAQVHLEGLDQTHDDLVVGVVSRVFAGQTYGEVAELIKEVLSELKSLGCFKQVNATLDSHEAHEHLLDVNFELVEHGSWRTFFDFDTTNYNDSRGAWIAMLPNLGGRGERLQLELSRSWQRSDEHALKAVWPNLNSTLGPFALVTGMSFESRALPWSMLQKRVLGWNLLLIQNTIPGLESRLELKLAARQMRPSGADLPFAQRVECGYSSLASLAHQLTVDTRDDCVIPRVGQFLRWAQEWCGYPGNTHLVKHSLALAAHVPLGKSLSLSLAASAGMATPLRGSGDNPMGSGDIFAFQNPLQCRGWLPSAIRGQTLFTSDQSQILASASVKLSSPIPLLRGSQSWLYSNTRTHMFLDFGALGRLARISPSHLLSNVWMDWTHAGLGVGFVMRLGNLGRAEVNYVLPLQSLSNLGSIGPCLQFGMAVDFL